MNLDPDLELVQQCQSRDPAVYEGAFYQIYEKYGERVYNISYRILGDSEDALDVTQDAFLTLFKKIAEFRQDSRFFTWFYRIVVNLSIDQRRKRSSAPLVTESDREGTMAELADKKSDTIEKLAWNEFLEKNIQASLLKISPNLRVVTVLRYIEGLSYAEIADVLDCSIGTVKSRLNRAHKNLEASLQPVIKSVRDQEVDSD